jgi:UDP-3-O-[3-hydroxymyristoyl] glucosamine N-acyltransferase
LGCACESPFADVEISAITDPADADEHSITFVSNPRFLQPVRESKAVAVIARPQTEITGKILLAIDDPYLGFARVAQLFEDVSPLFGPGIHTSATVDPTAKVHGTTSIGPFCVVGKDCSIGKGSVLGAHCIVENGTTIGENCRIDSGAIIRRNCKIGNRVIVQSGAVIGGEGFGNAREQNGRWERIPSFGAVVIEDDAEIGANTTIDRGTFRPTIIGKGVKIDNLCMVAHNVHVGENTALAAQVGISGSTVVGKRAILAGQAGFVGHIEIGDDAFVGAQAGVAKSIGKGEKVTGTPSRSFMTMRRIEASQMQLPDLIKEVRKLRKEIENLKKEK